MNGNLCIIAMKQPLEVVIKEENNLGLVLSLIAIIVSVGTAIFQFFWSKKFNQTNLQADLIKEIYWNYLIHDVPSARLMMHYNDEILNGADELRKTLNLIRRDSLFFKYNDKKFYNKLKKQLQDLEDELVVHDETRMTHDEFSSFNTKLNNSIEEIYNTIMNKYLGTTVK